jgi:hypothetical protein
MALSKTAEIYLASCDHLARFDGSDASDWHENSTTWLNFNNQSSDVWRFASPNSDYDVSHLAN